MLRNRIYLNLIPFAVILIAVVAYAVFVFSQLASNVGTTIADNYQSDSAAQKMADALARMDAALQASRTQDKASARLVVDTTPVTSKRICDHYSQTPPPSPRRMCSFSCARTINRSRRLDGRCCPEDLPRSREQAL